MTITKFTHATIIDGTGNKPIENGIIVGKWKLVQASDRVYELYDLNKDPQQKRNLAATHSEVRKNLIGFYNYWKEKLAKP